MHQLQQLVYLVVGIWTVSHIARNTAMIVLDLKVNKVEGTQDYIVYYSIALLPIGLLSIFWPL